MLVSENSLLSKNSHKSSFNNDNNSVSYPSRTIVHPKLEMTEPGDADEQEADAAANEVMSGKVFRKFSGAGAGGGMAVSSQMESQLNQLQGGGQAMPDGLRGMMERGFDRDFSQVRLHTDGEAASLSDSIHAKAFTHGNDIYFNQGQYAPETSEGQRLVAHELAHVAQGGGKVGRKAVFPRRPHLYETKLLDAKGNTKRLNYKTEAIVSEERKALIENDLQRALEMVNACIKYLEDESSDFELYNNYFPKNNPKRFAYVLNNYRKIRDVILKKDIEFSYSHVKPYVDKDGIQYFVAAYVTEDNRYAIALSSFYFKQSDVGRAESLIHELAHEVNKYIGDSGYGRNKSRALAGRYRSTLNADSYRFFADEVMTSLTHDIIQESLSGKDDLQENMAHGIESNPQTGTNHNAKINLPIWITSPLASTPDLFGSLIKAPTNIYKPTFNFKKVEGGRFVDFSDGNPFMQTGLWVKSYDNLGLGFLFPQNSSSLILSTNPIKPGLFAKYTYSDLFQLSFDMKSGLNYGATVGYTPHWFGFDSVSATLKGDQDAIREVSLTYGLFDFIKLQFSYVNDAKKPEKKKIPDVGKIVGVDDKIINSIGKAVEEEKAMEESLKKDEEGKKKDRKGKKVDRRFRGKTVYMEFDLVKLFEFIRKRVK